ncbi:hypothetical protein [Carboxydothermus pertinax]|uniref:Uncharacterized protein n=1 Tax=Carboxydothermus pertinax TaxID=870242 RepID=A0A1L8CRS3_9THEO|nr:hypothetical protein [Carboxydothermus pertinax]GAV21626.1 hypothetical protein cpu_01360 [Carboxydothermus pertinax]
MLQIENIAFWSDIISLPKETLRDICIKLELSDKGTVDELCERIWERIRGNKELQLYALENARHQLLGGKRSITWFTLDTDLHGFKNIIISSLSFNPFEEIKIPETNAITTEPVIIAGAEGDSPGEYYLRFMYRVGNVRFVYGTEVSYRPQAEITTAYINESKKIIEVRSEPKKAEKIAQSLARIAHQQINLSQIKFVDQFRYNAEAIADALCGQLFDAKARPETFENISEDQAKIVVEILNELDKYLANEDFDALKTFLESTREKFGEECLATPFTALILNGLNRIGMGVNGRDLRGLPLYDYIRPFIQPQGGYIQFPYSENNVMKLYTIRVGLTTNSIQFITPATEGVLRYIRDRLQI